MPLQDAAPCTPNTGWPVHAREAKATPVPLNTLWDCAWPTQMLGHEGACTGASMAGIFMQKSAPHFCLLPVADSCLSRPLALDTCGRR